MKTRALKLSIIAAALGTAFAPTGYADPFFFTTGSPDGRMATASRPGLGGKIEIESADDFLLAAQTIITSGTFTGLITGGGLIGAVDIEIYRVFPLDSDTVRTINVPTRANSPSDDAFASRDTGAATLNFSTLTVSPTFTAANSVLNGINKSPNQTTLGEGPVTGTEVQFNFNLTSALNLPAGHYFFIPQVQVAGGEFMWLSTSRAAPLFTGDLQEWIRNAALDPDWLRVGTDIVGGTTPPTFNAAFSLNGTTVPDVGRTLFLLGLALGAVELLRRSKILRGGRS